MTEILTAPVIETERLVLRAYRRGDFDAYCAMMARPGVYRHLGPPLESRSQLWEKFLRGPGFWPVLGYGFWVAERRSDGAMIGNLGFGEFERGTEPPLPDLPEMGWVFDDAVHGQGYAGEALAAVLRWGDMALDTAGTCCIISPENRPSLRLADRHGFQAIGETVHHGDRVIILTRSQGG